MGRPRLATVEVATPDRILAAAEDAFAASGLARATLADIGARAGISRPSLLYHFPTKEALYAEVVQRTFRRLGAVLAEAIAVEAPFPARVERLVRAFAAFLDGAPNHARIVVRELLEDDGPGAAIVRDEVAPLLDAVVAFITLEGGPWLRLELDVRAAVLQVVSDVFLRNASGALRESVWGPRRGPDETWALARALFHEEAR